LTPLAASNALHAPHGFRGHRMIGILLRFRTTSSGPARAGCWNAFVRTLLVSQVLIVQSLNMAHVVLWRLPRGSDRGLRS
jgi:hypothetical protein